MARWSSTSRSRSRAPRKEPLPAPLPPLTRTVGQVIAETIKLDGSNFWRALPLGFVVAALDLVSTSYAHNFEGRAAVLWAFAPLMAAAYVWGSSIATETRLDPRSAATAFLVALVIYLPFPFLVDPFVLPGLLFFGAFGLAVPAAVAEKLGLRQALSRGFALGRADLAHAVGGLAALAIVYLVSRVALAVLLRAQSDQAAKVAVFLGDVVLAPLLFLGGALLYLDQKARLELRAQAQGKPSASHSRR